MRIAFYAPLKAPDHPVPSGDRTVGRLIFACLRRGGHDPFIVSRLRSRAAQASDQREIRRRAEAEAERLIAGWGRDWQADLWLTYHLYYKAPDWVGMRVCRALGLPYVVVEPSIAPKRADGPFAPGHRASLQALHRAAAVICMTRHDMACVAAALPEDRAPLWLPPFIDADAWPQPEAGRARSDISERFGTDPSRPWLLAVGMLRHGDKLASYRALAAALHRLGRDDWQLLIAGDGPARPGVEALFSPFAGRVFFAGQADRGLLSSLYAASDLFVWPAVNEAYGMVFLEAQLHALPVVGAQTRGVPDVVRHGETGLLAEAGNEAAFAAAIAALLDDVSRRCRMGAAGRRFVLEDRGMDKAATRLGAMLNGG